MPELRVLQVEMKQQRERLDALEKRTGAFQKDADRRFEENQKEQQALAQGIASLNGKIGMMLTILGNVRDAVRLSAKVDTMEERLQ